VAVLPSVSAISDSIVIPLDRYLFPHLFLTLYHIIHPVYLFEISQHPLNMRARARTRTQVQSLNNAKPSMRDKVQDLRLQQDSDTRGEVLLIFWYIQGSIYIV
jgi:hypothetical protein